MRKSKNITSMHMYSQEFPFPRSEEIPKKYLIHNCKPNFSEFPKNTTYNNINTIHKNNGHQHKVGMYCGYQYKVGPTL